MKPELEKLCQEYIGNRDAVKKALGLSDTQLMMLNHPVGYPAEEFSAGKKKESGTKK